MHNKMVLATTGIMLGVLLSGTPLTSNFYQPLTVLAAETNENVSYNSGTSIVTIKPEATGKTVFSYKINGEYPKYTKDTVSFFNADGTLKEEKTGLLGQAIFTDDITTWLDVTKQTPHLGFGTDYYNRLCLQDAECILPYSENNDTNEFYIPALNVDDKIEISVANIADDGSVSEIKTSSFSFDGVSIKDVETNATIKSVDKTSSSETVRISGDNIQYVNIGNENYTATNNSVDIKLTSNGDKTFLVYGQDAVAPDVLTYTVTDLVAEVDKEIVNETVDTTAPVITSDAVPSTEQDTAIKFKVYTDEKATISCNGVSAEGTELELTIAGNGDYLVTATDEAGNYSEKTITFDCFTDIVGEYELDRDAQWGEDQTPEGRLPQTGQIGLLAVLGIGGGFIGAGTYLTKKSKGKKEDK